jgi:N-carbamoyl-L-amino-acid hydrolase
LSDLSANLGSLISRIQIDHGVRISNDQVLDAAPVIFDAELCDVLERSTKAAGLRSTRMVSGAGHDAVQLAHVMPTAMLFIPCVDGVSHAEHEDITQGWATNGATVLLNAVIALAKTS